MPGNVENFFGNFKVGVLSQGKDAVIMQFSTQKSFLSKFFRG